MNLEVKQVDDRWGLFIDDHLLGTSKTRFDADHAKQILLNCTRRLRDDVDRLSRLEFPDTSGGQGIDSDSGTGETGQ